VVAPIPAWPSLALSTPAHPFSVKASAPCSRQPDTVRPWYTLSSVKASAPCSRQPGTIHPCYTPFSARASAPPSRQPGTDQGPEVHPQAAAPGPRGAPGALRHVTKPRPGPLRLVTKPWAEGLRGVGEGGLAQRDPKELRRPRDPLPLSLYTHFSKSAASPRLPTPCLPPRHSPPGTALKPWVGAGVGQAGWGGLARGFAGYAELCGVLLGVCGENPRRKGARERAVQGEEGSGVVPRGYTGNGE